MMKREKLLRFGALAASVLLLASCMSVRLSSMKDDELVKAGVKAWNTQKYEDARPYWEAIRDPALKAKYLGYFDAETEVENLEQKAIASKGGAAADEQKAYNSFVEKYSAFPKELSLPSDIKGNLKPVAVEIAQSKVKAVKFEEARSFIKDATALWGDDPAYDKLQKEMDAYGRIQAEERSASRSYDNAKSVQEFNAQIDAYESAIAAYQKVENDSAAEMKKLGSGSDSCLAVQASSLRKKRGAVRIERDRLVRERGDSFKDRIGEEFARVPDGNKLGNMSAEDILNYNKQIRANIEDQYKDIMAFSQRYPSIIDKDMIKDIDAQKASLDQRISQIDAEVRHAKDIASRGKALMPLMIGLFNPAPASKAEGQKSRPAELKGNMSGDADYWWGMVSIDRGQMNDLVITMKDGKEVQVYAENTLSGSQIKKKGLKNLVNRGSRIGNSWPVLNAGAVLPSGLYFIRVMSNGKPSYSGEVVVYKSFVSRVR